MVARLELEKLTEGHHRCGLHYWKIVGINLGGVTSKEDMLINYI
jgi:hypothetical protein